jgi:hypothetical protein
LLRNAGLNRGPLPTVGDVIGKGVTALTALLRRTSGKVVSVLVATTDGQAGEPDVWIGWMSVVPAKRGAGESEKNSWLVATLRTTPTLARVSRPITIA